MMQPKLQTESFVGLQKINKQSIPSVRTPIPERPNPLANPTGQGTSQGQAVREKRRGIDEFVAPVPSPKSARSNALKSYQLWIGTVTSASQDRFHAIVVDQTKADNPDEEAEFELEEVPEGDRPLVRPGSTFYWTIGMERTPAGSQKRVSMIQFRHAPKLTESLTRRAEELASSFATIFQ